VQCVGFGVVWLFSGALYEAMGGSAFPVMAGMAAVAPWPPCGSCGWP
jgi:hypothetical protein